MGDVLVIIGIIFVVLASIAWLFTLILAIYTGEYQRIQKRYDELKRNKKYGREQWWARNFGTTGKSPGITDP
ncbi:hypothetical protein C7Y71_001525 [Pseudoprevotella muciniphila]|uniref:Uncharacterized protein n=1 Tax=Pseudoprevotella muciniphila TaxID=2133944 RepID=A0A5P8E4E8_9BACT|nr:hypothetical protein C7Y71_001525 [Pseudoprevotella muciniphila]